MKKSIVALAVSSAALASISAYAAEDTTVGFYGNIQYAYVSDSADDAASQHGFKDNGSSLGFKGESKIDDATTAFFNVKYKVDASAKNEDASVTLDNAYVGVKGNFGTVKAGTFDSIYNDAIQDPVNQFEWIGFNKATTSDEGKTVAYFTPTISGFQLQLSAGLGTESNADATTTPATAAVDTRTAYTGVVKYSNDMVTVALAYDDLQNKSAKFGSSTGLNVTVAPIENLALNAKYETVTDGTDASNDAVKNIGLGARYGYGMGDIYASYENVKPDASGKDDYNEYGAGVSYSVNSSMYVYTELSRTGSDKVDTSVMGVVYSF